MELMEETGPMGTNGTVITPEQLCKNPVSSYPSTFAEREIEKIKKAARECELPKAKAVRVLSLRKMIVATANKLQKGIGW